MIELSILRWAGHTELSGPDVTIRLLIRRRRGGHNQRRCDHESREGGGEERGGGRERENMSGKWYASGLKMGDGATSQGIEVVSRIWKKQGNQFSPGAPRRDAVRPTL